jgi:hypothetical protein
MTATRQEVYAAIDGERAYQDKRWGRTASSGQPGDGSRTIDEWALYIEVYARKLAELAATTGDAESVNDKLDGMRKIAAMGVACMECYGAPHRS